MWGAEQMDELCNVCNSVKMQLRKRLWNRTTLSDISVNIPLTDVCVLHVQFTENTKLWHS